MAEAGSRRRRYLIRVENAELSKGVSSVWTTSTTSAWLCARVAGTRKSNVFAGLGRAKLSFYTVFRVTHRKVEMTPQRDALR